MINVCKCRVNCQTREKQAVAKLEESKYIDSKSKQPMAAYTHSITTEGYSIPNLLALSYKTFDQLGWDAKFAGTNSGLYCLDM